MIKVRFNDTITQEFPNYKAIYLFLWGFMLANFRTRYTMKMDVFGEQYYYILGCDVYGKYIVNVYDLEDVCSTFESFDNIHEVLEYITGYHLREVC